jgi:phosphoribosylformylglycinamidine (FGAM) synthase-like enzyme
MWQFIEAVKGIGEACRFFEIPITGGNVSLYNETDGQPIFPTPVLGIVGLVEDASKVVGRAFPEAGLTVLLLGETRAELGATEYLHAVHGQVRGLPPQVDLSHERALQQSLPALVQAGLVQSAHDCAEGGLAVALAECCFGGVGATVALTGVSSELGVPAAHVTLFSESAGRVVMSVRSDDVEAVRARCAQAGIPVASIGSTGGGRLRITVDDSSEVDADVAELDALWGGALEAALSSRRG